MNIPIDQVFEALYAMRHDSGFSNEYTIRAELLTDRVLRQLTGAELETLRARTEAALAAIPREEYED